MKQPAQTTPTPAATERTTSPPKFWTSWRWWLPPAVIALILILIFVDPFIGDWDGLDYTILALRGLPSSMALGRGLFTLYNHYLYLLAHALFNTQPHDAYLVFKYAVVIQGPLTVIAVWVLARDLLRSLQAATLAALLLAFSPVFIIYSGQVMTDVPAVLMLCLSLIVHLRGLQKQKVWLVLIGAAMLGAGVNLRETIGFYAPWLVLAPFVCGWRISPRELLTILVSCLVFLLCAVGPFAYWFLSDPVYRTNWYGWRESMRLESALHPVQFKNIFLFLAYFFVTSPLVVLTLPFAIRKEARERGLTPLLLLASVGVIADLLLLLNYSTSIVWRYPLASLPALAPLTGDYLVRRLTPRLRTTRKVMTYCTTAIVLLAILFGLYVRPISRQFILWRTLAKTYNRQLDQLPKDSVVMAGQQSVAVNYWRGIGEGQWDAIGTGSGWPGDGLTATINNYLEHGRRVFVDSDPRWWFVCGWQRQEIPELVAVESSFHYRRVSEFIYEIRPLSDSTATDSPNFSRLLPENRPLEVKKCPLGR